MNLPFVPLDSKLIPRPAATASIWDLLALELSNEWRGLDADDAEWPERDALFSPSCGARSATRR
jgi:hypothetical protein